MSLFLTGNTPNAKNGSICPSVQHTTSNYLWQLFLHWQPLLVFVSWVVTVTRNFVNRIWDTNNDLNKWWTLFWLTQFYKLTVSSMQHQFWKCFFLSMLPNPSRPKWVCVILLWYNMADELFFIVRPHVYMKKGNWNCSVFSPLPWTRK